MIHLKSLYKYHGMNEIISEGENKNNEGDDERNRKIENYIICCTIM